MVDSRILSRRLSYGQLEGSVRGQGSGKFTYFDAESTPSNSIPLTDLRHISVGDVRTTGAVTTAIKRSVFSREQSGSSLPGQPHYLKKTQSFSLNKGNRNARSTSTRNYPHGPSNSSFTSSVKTMESRGKENYKVQSLVSTTTTNGHTCVQRQINNRTAQTRTYNAKGITNGEQVNIRGGRATQGPPRPPRRGSTSALGVTLLDIAAYTPPKQAITSSMKDLSKPVQTSTMLADIREKQKREPGTLTQRINNRKARKNGSVHNSNDNINEVAKTKLKLCSAVLERVNYCDINTTLMIEKWLREVFQAQTREGKCINIRDESLMRDPSE